MTTGFNLQETVDILTPVFDPVVRDIQDIKKTNEQLLEHFQQESKKESEIEAGGTASTDSEQSEVETSVEKASEALTSLQAVETETETQAETETEETIDYLPLIYEEIHMQNAHMETLIENQTGQNDLIVEGSLGIILAVVISVAVSKFVGQATKW